MPVFLTGTKVVPRIDSSLDLRANFFILYEDYKKKYSTSIKVGFLLGVVLMVVVI